MPIAGPLSVLHPSISFVNAMESLALIGPMIPAISWKLPGGTLDKHITHQ